VSEPMNFDYQPGRFGARSHAPGIVLQERLDFAMASVLARRDRAPAMADAAERYCGVRPPAVPAIASGPEMSFIWSGPGHWVALAEASATSIDARLEPLHATASVIDQSDARVMLDLSGRNVREMLAKGIALDLHPRAFKTGDAALTSVSHIAVQFWQVADAPAYRLLVTRSYFFSFWRWLAASAAEFGGEVLPPRPYTNAGC
jgi:methylglutamate dehydrogenase subunit D